MEIRVICLGLNKTIFKSFHQTNVLIEKEKIDSNIDLLRKFQLRNMFLDIELVNVDFFSHIFVFVI